MESRKEENIFILKGYSKYTEMIKCPMECGNNLSKENLIDLFPFQFDVIEDEYDRILLKEESKNMSRESSKK